MRDQGRIVIVYIIDFMATREGVTGGTERQLAELISRLDRVRFRPILFCLQEFCRTPCWDGIDCEKHVLHVYSLGSWEGVAALRSFIAFLKTNSVDIVQSFFHDSTLFGITAARIAGVKKTISCRRDLGFWYDEKALRNLSLVNRITHRILVNSNAVKDAVSLSEHILPDKIDVILNGIDVDAVEKRAPARLQQEFPSIEPGDRVVGMVANLNREVKRSDVFIRAAAEVRERLPRVKFLVIGTGRLEHDLKRLVHDLDLDHAVILAGARDSAIEYIKSFHIGVLTSDSEGLSNVILEYMAAGIPVVATDVGGNREIIRDGALGVLVPPDDHHALADALIDLLEHDPRRAEMGARAKRLIRDTFAWEKKIGEISMYYEKLLSSP